MHNLTKLQRTPKYLLSDYSMFVTSMPFTVGIWLYAIKTSKLSCTVIRTSLLLWRYIVRIAITTHALSVHCAHAVRVNRLVTAFNFANAWHCPTVAGNGIIPFAAAGRQHCQHRALAELVLQPDVSDELMLVGAEVHTSSPCLCDSTDCRFLTAQLK